jgi:hypothetical protein
MGRDFFLVGFALVIVPALIAGLVIAKRLGFWRTAR